MIKKFNKVDSASLQELESFFHQLEVNRIESDISGYDTDSLGFGWVFRRLSYGGGQAAIKGNLLYFEGSLTSIEVFPELPEETKYKKKYMNWFSTQFEIKDDSLLPIKIIEEAFFAALSKYLENFGQQLSDDVLYYMSPLSGSRYISENKCVHESARNKNREIFNSIIETLDTFELIAILYGKHPISRITALEYMLKNEQNYPELDDHKEWIQKLTTETPRIRVHECDVERGEISGRGCRISFQNGFEYLGVYQE